MTAPPAPAERNGPWVVDFLMLATAWGAAFLFMRVATREFGALPTAFLRTFVAALFLVPLMAMRGQARGVLTHWRPLLVVGTINSAIPFACFSYALLSITAGLSSILNAATPLFGAVVAWAWMGDRPGRSRTLGLAVGFIGVALLAWDKASFRPDASGLSTGVAVIACLVAALCYGIAASFTRRYLTGVPTLVTAAGSQIGASLGLLLPTVWLWPATVPSPQAWAAAIVAGVVSTGFAYILYFRIIERAGASRALAVTFVNPVFAVIFGAVFLGEEFTAWMALCGVVIALGTALATGLIGWPRRRS